MIKYEIYKIYEMCYRKGLIIRLFLIIKKNSFFLV